MLNQWARDGCQAKSANSSPVGPALSRGPACKQDDQLVLQKRLVRLKQLALLDTQQRSHAAQEDGGSLGGGAEG